jgi:Na+-transporting NADH:ubiquinone oxidoreductase subunit F
VADSYIANYGEVHIVINEQKDLEVEGGSPLLFSLMGEGIFVPSACGGKGTCALCKLQVLDGGGPVLPTEKPYLSPEEIDASVRLSCQVKVRNDLKIQIPDELFNIKEFQAMVEEIQDLTPTIKGIHLKILSPEEGIRFKAGQYIQVWVPAYELSKESEYRAYSICSGPYDPMSLDLVITKVPEGVVSTYVHDFLKEGDQVTIAGPYGEFYLRESDREILFIATGSGLAPIKSILHQMEKEKIDRKATLYFGARTREDLYYWDRLKKFEETVPDFTFLPTLSRATEEDRWEGEQGRVTDLIDKYIRDSAEIEVYMCGNPAMVESCEKLLQKKGIPQERIYYDKFA